MTVRKLLTGYRTESLDPEEVINRCYERIDQVSELQHIWIHLIPRNDALAAVQNLPPDRNLPLWGIPFAVKDNIDVEGLPTTAACPDYKYVAEETAPVVQRLLDAGAILIGKTNMDQFATGLVGVRSPFGSCHSVFDSEYVSGGSSSGSAVAVALGLVAFSLGTDTAGSGRVPAAFNHLIGLKPTRGYLSCSGVVPACKSLDCVSIFTNITEDAEDVLSVAGAPDPADPYSRMPCPRSLPTHVRIGVPLPEQLEFFGDTEAATLFTSTVSSTPWVLAEVREIDVQPFLDTAKLLYNGPFVAERLMAAGELLKNKPESLLPVLVGILKDAYRWTATDVFEAFAKLEATRKAVSHIWKDIDVLLLPTTGTIYKIADVQADPVKLNSTLGYYTNFVNLLDLCAIATPAGFRSNGLPFGVQWIAPAWTDIDLLRFAEHWQKATEAAIELAVVGAHLRGQPLHHQIAECGGYFLRQCKTAPNYRLYELAQLIPPKPGLVRVEESGAQIEVEVYRIPQEGFGRFVAHMAAPLSIGTVLLEDGSPVRGFLCESVATRGAVDITKWGGWRAWLKKRWDSSGA